MKRRNAFIKMAGLFMAIAMLIGVLPTKALAAPTWGNETEGSLTIHKTNQDKKPVAGAGYTIYQVAELTQDKGTMKYESKVPGVTVTGDTTAADFDVDTLTPFVPEQVTDGTNNLVFDHLPLGVYLVQETTTPAGVIQSNNFIVSIPMSDASGESWDYDVTAEPKNSVFSGSVSKTLSEGGEAVGDASDKKWTVNVGEEVEYTITATMPSDFYGAADAKKYTQFDVVDTPGTGLQLVAGSIKATVDGTEVAVKTTEGTPAKGFTVSLLNDTKDGSIDAAIVAGKEVVITYNAKITKDGIGQAIENDVKINYNYDGSNDPDVPGTQEPKPEDPNPELYTYSHGALKVDDASAALDGAEFVLQLSNGKYLALNSADNGWTEVSKESEAFVFKSGTQSPLASFTDKGYFSVVGVKGGTHKLIETKAPAGYTLLKAPVDVKFDENSTSTVASNGHTTKIVNAKGFTLPGTGGVGIIIYIGAGILLVAFGLLLYSKKRKLSSK